MKKIHPSIFVLSAVIIFTSAINLYSQCSYNWVPQSSGTASGLYCVKAVNVNICWVGGAPAIVLKTTNGGAVWTNANPNPGVIAGQVNCIDALDENNAWLTSTNSGSTFIYRTTNGGSTWQQVYTASQITIFGLKMSSLTNGFAFGDPVSNTWQLLLTTNGGINWQLSPNAPSAQFIEHCLPRSFYVSLPNIWWGTSITTIYRSTDNGISWSSHDGNVSGIYILAIHYNSPENGLGASISMSRSTNGGVSYAGLPAPGSGNISGIEGEGNNYWFIRGTQIYSSTNNGDSWQNVHTAAQTLNHIDFPDGLTGCQTGWVVGMGGVIYKLSPLTGITPVNNNIPESYRLEQNYPNPFNPETVIKFSVSQNSYSELKIYDILGNEIDSPVKQELKAGNYSVTYSMNDLPAGVYFYKLRSGNFTETRKMVLVK